MIRILGLSLLIVAGWMAFAMWLGRRLRASALALNDACQHDDPAQDDDPA